MTDVATVEQTDVLEERIIDAEYKIWKKSKTSTLCVAVMNRITSLTNPFLVRGRYSLSL